MLSQTPPMQGSRTPAPNLIVRRWWRRNIVVVSAVLGVLVLAIAGIIFGSSRLLFLLPKQSTPPAPDPIQPAVVSPQPPAKIISDVVVPKEVGEDNFYLKPVEFDSMGMGSRSEIVLTSKVDMDTESVLFHLTLDPVFSYDVTSATAREIRIKPKEPFVPGALYRFRLPTTYMDGDSTIARLYKWGYQTKQPIGLSQSIPRDGSTDVALNSPIILTLNSDDIDTDRLMSYVDIRPSIQGNFIQRWNHYVFEPRQTLKPSTVYTVTVKKGLTLKKSSSVLDHDLVVRFTTGAANGAVDLSNPESLIPDQMRSKPGDQERRAREELGLYPHDTPINTPPPLNEDHYRDVLSLSAEEAVPLEKLPRAGEMDLFVVPKDGAPLWERALRHFQDGNDVHSVVSTHVMKTLFDRVGVGTPSLAQESAVLPLTPQDQVMTPGFIAPYPANDLSITELLALIAYADPTWLSSEDLKSYFRSLYFSYDATPSERAQAAFGLASLGDPYIQEQVNLLNDPRLSPLDRLYLGLGLDRLGATEYTILIYYDTLKDNKVRKNGGHFIETLQSPVRNQYATLLTALAGFTFDREDKDLREYLDSFYGGNGTFIHTVYLTQRLVRQPAVNMAFDMSFDATHKSVVLDGSRRMAGETITASMLRTLKISGDRSLLRLLIAY